MSPETRPQTGLQIEPRPLAPEASLAGELVGGTGSIRVPLASDLVTPPQRRAGTIAAEAFGRSGQGTGSKLERVLAGEGFAVTTGHQPILFLGPLYVLYKTLTAVELARRLEAAWGVPVLPVFWIASDDHDWDEVAGTTLLDGDRPVRLELAPTEGRASRPVGPSTLGSGVSDRIRELSQLLPPSEFVSTYLDHIESSYRPTATYSEAFARLLSALLGERSYAWLDASGPDVKRAAAAWFEEMVDDPAPYLGAGEAGFERLRAHDHEPPIPALEGALPLFFDTGHRRERLYTSHDGIAAGRSGDGESPDVWRARLREDPDAFSPNVSSRPVLESRLLPVAATVLGPGEIAYWSQLPELFDVAGAPFPAIQPRAAWTVVEPRVRKILERYELDPEDLQDGGDAAAAELTRSSRPEAVDASLAELRGAIGGALESVERAVGDSLPGIKGTVGKARKGLFDAVQELAKGIDRETRQRLDSQLGQVRRCAAALFPDRRPQERVLSPFHFLSRYGSGFVDEIEAATRGTVDDALAGLEADG